MYRNKKGEQFDNDGNLLPSKVCWVCGKATEESNFCSYEHFNEYLEADYNKRKKLVTEKFRQKKLKRILK